MITLYIYICDLKITKRVCNITIVMYNTPYKYIINNISCIYVYIISNYFVIAAYDLTLNISVVPAFTKNTL